MKKARKKGIMLDVLKATMKALKKVVKKAMRMVSYPLYPKWRKMDKLLFMVKKQQPILCGCCFF